MATATRRKRITVGPADHGRKMAYADFIKADFKEGWLYELARGIIVVTQVPGLPHGRIVMRIGTMFALYDVSHPGVINYRAGGGECRLRLPGMKSDRHPDQAVYLVPNPPGGTSWERWAPNIVVEVVSRGGKRRDYVEKREEYLRIGVSEYWILDPKHRRFTVLSRAGDIWEETTLAPGAHHRTHLLPGLDVNPEELFGPLEGI